MIPQLKPIPSNPAQAPHCRWTLSHGSRHAVHHSCDAIFVARMFIFIFIFLNPGFSSFRAKPYVRWKIQVFSDIFVLSALCFSISASAPWACPCLLERGGVLSDRVRVLAGCSFLPSLLSFVYPIPSLINDIKLRYLCRNKLPRNISVLMRGADYVINVSSIRPGVWR